MQIVVQDPMTWSEPENVALIEPFPNDPAVLHAIGLIQRRECGCTLAVGRRLDVMEPTFGAAPCDRHHAEVSQALRSFAAAPPSGRQVLEMFREILDAAIG